MCPPPQGGSIIMRNQERTLLRRSNTLAPLQAGVADSRRFAQSAAPSCFFFCGNLAMACRLNSGHIFITFGINFRCIFVNLGSFWSTFRSQRCFLGDILGALWPHFWCKKADWGTTGVPKAIFLKNKVAHLDPRFAPKS